VKSAELFVKVKEEEQFRKCVGVTLKNIVKNYWDGESVIPSALKTVDNSLITQKLRVVFLNGVVLNAAFVDIRCINVRKGSSGFNHR